MTQNNSIAARRAPLGTISATLKEMFEAFDKTGRPVKELAWALNTDASTIRRYRIGERYPSIKRVERFAEYLRQHNFNVTPVPHEPHGRAPRPSTSEIRTASPSLREFFDILAGSNVSDKELAFRLKIDIYALRHYRGGVNCPSLMRFEEMADALGYEVVLRKMDDRPASWYARYGLDK